MNMNKRIVTLLLFLVGACGYISAQKVSLKTNLFYGAYTYTPNLGIELSVGKRSTFEIAGGYNPWDLNGTSETNKKLVHWIGQMEYRYWFCQKFNGHFLGAHILGSEYNISQHKLPLLFGSGSENYRFQGWGAGAGLSYGYQFILGRRWNLELNAGIGYARLQYDKYECRTCGEKVGSEKRNYFGPTKAGISLIYIIK